MGNCACIKKDDRKKNLVKVLPKTLSFKDSEIIENKIEIFNVNILTPNNSKISMAFNVDAL